ncbi:hypothetical protein KA005_75160 [bacterium]|nr:hypothetical protein [bacterium]
MKKKIALGLIGVVALVAGVAGMAAYEAHVINVTAHIENALAVTTAAIDFGVVFPQEYEERDFIIKLSDSFMQEDQTRVKDVLYKIVQKTKCICVEVKSGETQECKIGNYAPVGWDTHTCPTGYEPMPDLCPFLSKIPESGETDIGVPSYYIDAGVDSRCEAPFSHIATGRLEKCHPSTPTCGDDTQDCWTVDLKVPPVAGSVGQDWPATCAPWVVPTDGVDYGCDLWIEVVDFSYFSI